MEQVPVLPPSSEVAVMMASPAVMKCLFSGATFVALTKVTTPEELTLVTCSLLLVHFTRLFVALLGETLAVSRMLCWPFP